MDRARVLARLFVRPWLDVVALVVGAAHATLFALRGWPRLLDALACAIPIGRVP